ncbi:CDP-glucose 4,6-dehydratase [Roseburia sp. MSJ-14]|uniref:CDP-glucose 4,6-dehydratase n=1 Tax=Roseburia sp. MSJ-14 TaxID=2841514 RepID=UPI001C10F9DD|nr:CDP-glucose 4,6-dehydratase [Roseburia sp. MSJ-14]MBU5474776.1 CDP-glucose 4,6-dehydratase [Roseburia sp. MSJ-14]
MVDTGFYKNRKVLITGHTGFKGAWMCQVLKELGADVTGYALKPPTDPSLFFLCKMEQYIHSVEGDIRDLKHLQQVFERVQPEIVIHMAAQPIVRESYKNPVYTYDVNVMGTVNVMECVRLTDSVKSVVNVTTDKVYKNKEWEWGYRENEELNGFDPYSNSKSCSELVTESYKNSFFADRKTAISTARAGNVVGGGDFAADRIIPDCVRAIENNCDIVIRNPHSTRPYQHVLEPIFAYLMIAEKQYKDAAYAGHYNVGPDENSCVTTGELVGTFCKCWNSLTGKTLNWVQQGDGGPHEANFLKLDCSKIKSKLGWKPKWNYEEMLEKTVEWVQSYIAKKDVSEVMMRQIYEYKKAGRE